MDESYTGVVNNTQKLLIVLIGISISLNLISLIGFSLRDWDEGVFALQGQWLASGFIEGKPYNLQTPPLYPLIAGIGLLLFKGNALILPLLSFIFSITTLVIVYNIANFLYNRETAFYSVALFAANEYFFFFSKSALSDSMFLFFFTAAVLYLLYSKTGHIKYFLLSGIFITLAMYTKYSGMILIIYAIILGIITGMNKDWKWYIFHIAMPLILFLPIIYFFSRFTSVAGTGQRLLSLFGINYHRHLFYLIVFAPTLILTAIISQFKRPDKNMSNKIILIMVAIYFVFLGLYYPYFRLAYPLIMFIAIIGASSNIQSRIKSWVVLIATIIGIAFSIPTIVYQNRLPIRFAHEVLKYIRKNDVKVLFSSTTPNIEYYLEGSYAIPDNHSWYKISEKYPIFKGKNKILHHSENELKLGEEILIAHATINDSLKVLYPEIFENSQLILAYNFIDAPLYLKDIFNPAQEQNFELYKIEINDQYLADKIWQFGFNKGISVLIY